MTNGQPYYGGGDPPSVDPGSGGASAGSSGFGGATMGGHGYAGLRPQFGQQPGLPQDEYTHGTTGTFPPTQFLQQQQQQPPPQQQQQQLPQPHYGTYSTSNSTGTSYSNTNTIGQPAPSPGYPQTPQSQGPGRGGYPVGTGSVTRFATPTQIPQGGATPLFPQSLSPYSFQPPPQPDAAAATSMAGMSFAQRGVMLQQQQTQSGHGGLQPQTLVQHQQQPNQPQVNVQQPQQQQQQLGNTAGLSFAQRSAMMRQTQPPLPSSNVYGGAAPRQLPPPTQLQFGTPHSALGSPQSNLYSPQPTQPTQISHYAQQQLQPQHHAMPGQMVTQGSVDTYQQQHHQHPQQPHSQYRDTTMAGGVTNQQFQQFQQQPTGMPPQQFPGDTPAQQVAMMSQSQMSLPPQQPQPQYAGMPPQQQQHQPGTMPQMMQSSMQPPMPPMPPPILNIYVDPPEVIAQQNRLLTDATRKVQEHAYYMKQAMERHDLPTVLDRAAQMVGELGEHAHSHHHHHLHPPAPGASGTTTALSPKNYYELHLRALEELPVLEDYLLAVAQGANGAQQPNTGNMFATMTPGLNVPGSMMMPPQNTPGSTCTMRELYDYVQYCPNVLSRLYLQICAASALIRSGEVGTRWVLKDIIEAVKCVQNPVRGLFLRHYLLQAIRGKLPNEPIPPNEVVPYGMAAPVATATSGPAVVAQVSSMEKGTVKDSYEFILANFVQMNKLWVRIKHLPGDLKSKDIRRRREKDRNELRILVGTNLVRLSALDAVTSQIYGQVILPTVLDHIIISEDPLAQAYLIDCIVQVFPDEYHIETMPILLAACPKLRDKVNIRTILGSLMERLANYLAEEELLDEADSNQVKRQMAQDSFRMMDECVQSVYNARGPKLQAKEVIRLQTALLSFSMKCYRGNLEQITLCLDNCVVALQQARANQALMLEARNQHMDPNAPRILPQLEEVATKELETLLSIPLEELALGVLTLDHYADLIGFLPWANRRQVALTMLQAVSKAGKSPASMKEIEELFSVIAPVLRDEHENVRGQNSSHNQSMHRTTNLMAGLGVSYQPAFGQGNETIMFQEDPQYRKDAALVSKLIHLLHHKDTDIHFEMLKVAQYHLIGGKIQRTGSAFIALVFAGLNLAKRIAQEAVGKASQLVSVEEEAVEKAKLSSGEGKEDAMPDKSGAASNVDAAKVENEVEGVAISGKATVESAPSAAPEASSGKAEKVVTSRGVFILVQEAIAVMAKGRPEAGVKLYLESALTADRLASKNPGQATGLEAFGSIAYEFISQSFSLYEENVGDSNLQSRCIVAILGTLLACRSLNKADYESLIMKAAQYSAKMLRKPDQCVMVAQCSHLFFVVSDNGDVVYSNPQRSLECLQRALKLADACTTSNPANAYLFVDLLEHYMFFFEKKHPSISGNYVTGLIALIKEHTQSLGQSGGASKAHFLQILAYIKAKKEKEDFKEMFAAIDVGSI